MRPDEIGQAFQFGHEGTIRNILEPNWWETTERQEEQQQVADEVLRRERARQEGEDEEMDEEVEQKEVKPATNGDEKPRIVARTRVSCSVAGNGAIAHVRKLEFKPEEVAQFKSLGVTPRERSPILIIAG